MYIRNIDCDLENYILTKLAFLNSENVVVYLSAVHLNL